jgi:Flp pilus assembly protein TadB
MLGLSALLILAGSSVAALQKAKADAAAEIAEAKQRAKDSMRDLQERINTFGTCGRAHVCLFACVCVCVSVCLCEVCVCVCVSECLCVCVKCVASLVSVL